MFYLIIQITITLVSLAVAVYASGRAAYWREMARCYRVNAEFFHEQYVELWGRLGEQDTHADQENTIDGQ